ncbi:MAG: FG-GAP-like repeat-containing protein [Planctomycetaceae bacterium]
MQFSSRERKLCGGIIATATFLAAIVVWWDWSGSERRTDQLFDQAQRAFLARRYDEADQSIQKLLSVQPRQARALLLAGKLALARRNNHTALQHFRTRPDAASAEATQLAFLAGELLTRLGRVREAEVELRHVLIQEPQHIEANFILAFVLGSEGRAWECQPLVKELMRHGSVDVPQLLLVGQTDDFYIHNQEFEDLCRQATPNDPLILLGAARAALNNSQNDLAFAHLERVVTSDPNLAEAQARFGRMLISLAPDRYEAWQNALPVEADENPETWVTRGLWSQRQAQTCAAIRCFWEAARRDPNHRVAIQQMAQLLHQIGQPELAKPFVERTALLSQLAIPLRRANLAHDSDIMKNISDILMALRRPWEAAAWCQLAMRQQPAPAWAEQRWQELQPLLRDDPPLTLDSGNPARNVDLSAFPLPTRNTVKSPGGVSVAQSSSVPSIRFDDEARTTGLNFQFDNGYSPPSGMARMYSITGGGIGVLDYDGDGWPDLFLTQGKPIPDDVASIEDLCRLEKLRPIRRSAATDRLFRNLGGEMFQDVSDSAIVPDDAFGQGVAVGDFDNDGFPDLYVANLGPNCLYRNNGDGTFGDVTAVANVAGCDWTTSALIADLNGDSWPDVYATNYLTGPDVLRRVCGHDGHLKSCLPAQFLAAQDRVYLSRGDGTFEDRTESAGFRETIPGRGFGVIAADLTGTGGLSLFVGNDTDPNFLFVRNTDSQAFAMTDQGIQRGVALSGEGVAQACMGIACGDVDDDGRLDLFVSNFFNESNTLYLQKEPGFFADETRAAGLHEPSFRMLGWGTQFLDADGDGRLDLFVSNGHVYDERDRNVPFQMPAQFFRGTASARFVEVTRQSLGDYFQRELLGRAVAKCDWNRDGKTDLVVGHIDVPLALLTNHSPTVGRSISIQLRGTKVARDAVGSKIRCRLGNRHRTYQLVAGDGFLVSNERTVAVTLGPDERWDELHIRWPDGEIQEFSAPGEGHEFLVIQGLQQIVPRVR